jgi:UDP-glucose 4-epimerase
MARTLVTGGAGFIGSHIVDALVDRGHGVLVIDNLVRGKRENVNPAAELVELDVRDERAAELVRGFGPEVIFHHAAQMDVRKSVADPMYDADVNILGIINLMEAATDAGTRQVVFASSGGAIYGEAGQVPTPETAPLNPESPYGVSKLCSELYLGYYGRGKGMSCVSLRYANVYGPRQDPYGEGGVVAIFTSRLLAAEPCCVFGDGEQTRDYTHVHDVVAANLAAMEAAPAEPVSLNIGTGQETTVNELYAELSGITGGRSELRPEPAREGELLRSALDGRRAREVLGWEPQIPLRDGLREYVKYMAGQTGAA